MLIYANRLALEPLPSLDPVLETVATWLQRPTAGSITVDSILRNRILRFVNGSRVLTEVINDRYPIMIAANLTHPDSIVGGRQWEIDVGVRRDAEGSEIEFSVRVQTNEVSARVSSPPAVTRPLVVVDILRAFLPVEGTPGVTPDTLDEHTAERLSEQVFDPGREHPVVVVSPLQGGGYSVDLERLQSLVVGLADIFLIPEDANTFKVQDTLGRRWSAFNGAINIVFPMSPRDDLPHTRLLMSDAIDSLRTVGTQPETEILSLLTHRMNLPMSRRTLTVDNVSRERLRRRLSTAKTESTTTVQTSEYVKLLEEELQELERTAQATSEENEALYRDQESLERDNDDLRSRINELSGRISSIGQGTAGQALGIPDSRTLIAGALCEGADLEQYLTIIASLYPDRVVVLPSALESARASSVFKHPRRAFDLMVRLCTSYWECLMEGKGDAIARSVFGDAFAARESETVTNNRGAERRRTFQYRGSDLVMLKHLKIGVKDSRVDTWRCHFEWLAEEQRVVIGHCGNHLDFD